MIVYFCLHYASFKHSRPRDAYTEIPNGMWIFNLILKSLQYILYASYKLLISIDEDEVVSNVWKRGKVSLIKKSLWQGAVCTTHLKENFKAYSCA